MNIYVGNLNYRCQEEELKAHFEQYAPVASVKIIMDRETGRSKGFGFIEIDDEDAGQNAIDELDGADFQGRPLRVNLGRPQSGGGNRGGGGFRDNNRGGGGYRDNNRGGGGGYRDSNRGGGGGYRDSNRGGGGGYRDNDGGYGGGNRY